MTSDANLLDYVQILLLGMLVAYAAMREVGSERDVNPILGFFFMIVFLAVASAILIAVLAAIALGANWALGLAGCSILNRGARMKRLGGTAIAGIGDFLLAVRFRRLN